MAEPQISFKIGSNNLPDPENGSLIVTTDTHQLFVDDNNQHIEIGPYDIVKTWTESEHAELSLTDDEIKIIQSSNHCRIVLDGAPGYKTYLYRYASNIGNDFIDFCSSTVSGNVWLGSVDIAGKTLTIDKKDQNNLFVIEFTPEGSEIKSNVTFEETLKAYQEGKFLIGKSNNTTYLLQNYFPATDTALPSFGFRYINTRLSGSKIITETGTLVFRSDKINFTYNTYDTLNSSAIANTYVSKTELENKTHIVSLQYSGNLSADTSVNIEISDSDVKYIQENYYRTLIKVQDNNAYYIFYPSYVVLLAGVAFTYETLSDDVDNQGYHAYLTTGDTTLTITRRNKVATVDSVNGKLSKVTSSGSSRVYAIGTDGTQNTVEYANYKENTLIQRKSNGSVNVPMPVEALEAANKKYVDDAVSGSGGSDTHITWDTDNNAAFPANINATKFIGDGSELTGISTNSDVLVAHFTKPGSTYVCNKTFSEIKSAIDSGKSVIAVVKSQSGYAVSRVGDNYITFRLTLVSKGGVGCNVQDISMTLNNDESTSFGSASTWVYSEDSADSKFALKTDFDSMVVSISYDDATLKYTSDKTFTEIHDAIVNKKSVFLSYLPTGQYYTLESYSASNIIFTITYTSPMPTGVQVVQDQVSISSENVISPRTIRETQIKDYDTQISTLQKKITYGTEAPSGGEDGDIYIQLQS